MGSEWNRGSSKAGGVTGPPSLAGVGGEGGVKDSGGKKGIVCGSTGAAGTLGLLEGAAGAAGTVGLLGGAAGAGGRSLSPEACGAACCAQKLRTPSNSHTKKARMAWPITRHFEGEDEAPSKDGGGAAGGGV